MNKKLNNIKGVTLIEVTVILIIVSTVFLVVAGSFYQFGRGIFVTKARTIATNLAQEKVELLKNVSYHRLLVTQKDDLPENKGTKYDYTDSYDSRTYDPYKKEEILVGEITFTRQILIYKVKEENGSIKNITTPDTTSDTGLKKIIVTVLWREHGTTKNISVTNFRDDPERVPFSGKIYGVVTTTPTYGALKSARVLVVENPAWDTYTDENGSYELEIATGSWSLWVSKQGYWDYYSEPLDVVGSLEHNVRLTQRLTGIVTGYVVMNDHLVISQVVASTDSPSDFNQEYVELYNPTTSQIRFGEGGAGTNKWDYQLTYVYGNDLSSAVLPFDNVDFDSQEVWIPPGGFCLIANTTTLVIGGNTVQPNAVFSVPPPPLDDVWGNINGKDAGGIILYAVEIIGMVVTLNRVDSVAWAKSSGVGKDPPPSAEETEGYSQPGIIAVDVGNSLIRKSCAIVEDSWIDTNWGHAFDSNNNLKDFQHNVVYIVPRTTSTINLPRGGTPAIGAVVTCNDGVSSAVTCWSSGTYQSAYFEIEIATGTWLVLISSGDNYVAVSSVTVLTDQRVGVPNNVTDPPVKWPLSEDPPPQVFLSSSTDKGYVSGTVTSGGQPIDNIIVRVGAVLETPTDTSGMYSIPAEPDNYIVKANPRDANNPDYMTESTTCTVEIGKITTVDFNLSQGGRIYGWVTMNGFDALPNVVIKAEKSGLIKTTASGDDGYFWFLNISTGNWVVQPLLDEGESSKPTSKTAAVPKGETLFIDTFTVSGAMGTIEGKVKEGTKLVKTGILIIATTGTLDLDNPPEINSAYRSGSQRLYGTVSKSDGKYEVSVRGGYTYNVYAWYTKVTTRENVTFYKKSSLGIVVDQGEKKEANLSFP